ncbi:MAG: hypothetical protein ACRDCW_05935 [Sarcina sp.]
MFNEKILKCVFGKLLILNFGYYPFNFALGYIGIIFEESITLIGFVLQGGGEKNAKK